jgi:hypothetical protein
MTLFALDAFENPGPVDAGKAFLVARGGEAGGVTGTAVVGLHLAGVIIDPLPGGQVVLVVAGETTAVGDGVAIEIHESDLPAVAAERERSDSRVGNGTTPNERRHRWKVTSGWM